MTRARDTADTQDNLGGAVAPYVAGKNVLVNGAFDIWQRGTSFASGFASPYFIADRWQATRGGNVVGATMSRQTSGAPAGFQYYVRLQRDSGNTGTAAIFLAQCVETSMVFPYVNQTITLSFYARAGANYNASANNLNVLFTTGTGTDQNNFSNSYTGAADALTSTASLTTSWQRFSYTLTLGSTVTEFMPRIGTQHSGTAGAADYVDITGVQVELGAAATPFARAGGSIGGELDLCKRYYQRYPGAVGIALNGVALSTTQLLAQYILPEMRTSPSVASSGTIIISDQYLTDPQSTSTTVSVQGNGPMGGRVIIGTFTTLVVGRYYSAPGSAQGSGYLEFSAEL